MANINGRNQWTSVRLLETHELACGGVNGNLNEQAQALADRTELLMDEKASKNEIITGQREFSTYAAFNAAKETLPKNCTVIINEKNTTGTGAWGFGTNTWNGSTLSKSAYDPTSFVEQEAKKSTNAVLKNITITGDVTISESDASNKIIVFTGNLTADVTVTLPEITAEITLQNATMGGFSILLKVGASYIVELKNGEIFEIVLTATNIRKKNNLVARTNSPAFTGAPTSTTAPRGENSTQIATTAYVETAVSHTRTSVKTFTLTGDVNTEKTFTLDDLTYSSFEFSGVLTQDITFIIPKLSRGRWILRNYTTGNFNIYVKVLDQAASFLIRKAGIPVDLFSNGAEAYDITAQVDDKIDNALKTTVKAITLTGNYTLTTADIKNKVLVFIGNLTADTKVTFPAVASENTIQNATTGGFNLLLEAAAQATPVTTRNGEILEVFNTSDSVRLKNNLSASKNSPTFTGVPKTPTATRGENSTQIATTAYVETAVSHTRTSVKTFTLTGDVNTEKTFTLDDLTYSSFEFSGVLTQDITFIIPKLSRGRWILRNYTTGNFNIYVKVLDQAASFLIRKAGIPVDLFSNGAEAYDITAQVDDKIDNALKTTVKAITLTGNYTLTTADIKNKVLVFIGNLTADTKVTFPAVASENTIQNATTGGFNLLLEAAAQATPVTTRNGEILEVFNTSDSVRLKNNLSSPSLAYNSSLSINLAGSAREVILTVAQVDAAYLSITGLLTNDVTLIFPAGYRRNWTVKNRTDGPYNVYVKGSSQAVAASKLIKNSDVTMQQIYGNGFLIMVGESTGGDSGSTVIIPSLINTAYKGLFKFGEKYAVGDIVEHGSGNYVVVSEVASADVSPNKSSKYSKQSHNSYAGPNKELEAKSIKITADLAFTSIPESMSNNGMILYNGSVRDLQHSLDFGVTWETIYAKSPGTAVIWVKPLSNGELFYMDRNTTTQAHSMWRTVGYNYGKGIISSVVAITEINMVTPKMVVSPSWSFSTFENIVLVAQYGPKAGLDNGSGFVAAPGENARYVYMSLDYGVTWKTVLDLNAQVGTDAVHLHGVCYDPYWQRIWITSGDGAWAQTTTMYSDDLGETWTFAHRFIKGEGGNLDSNTATDTYRHQNVNIVALPTCILFATDGYPDGIQRIDRAQGKHTSDGLYNIEIGYYIDNGQTTGSYLCQAMCKSSLPDSPWLFGISSEFQSAPSVVVATYNGWNFFEVWRDTISIAPGAGIVSIVGITPKNQIVVMQNDGRSALSSNRTKIEINI